MPHQRKLVRSADMIVALTPTEARFLEGQGVDPSRVVVAGAGVDRSRLMNCGTHLRPEDPRFTVLVIGAMAADKGTNDIIRASQLLMNRGVDHRLQLIGPELSSFKRWYDANGIDQLDWIEKFGVVPEEVKWNLIDMADLVALPSRTESFGIVYLEGWAREKPVLAASSGAVEDVVTHMVDGYIVEFGRPAHIAEAVETLRSNPGLCARLGRAGRLQVETRYTWPSVLERIDAGIEQILGSAV